MAEKILIVDDEDGIRSALGEFFKLEGYSVVICGSGKDALEKWTPDIRYVVSDIRMPGMTGFELVKKLKQKKADIIIVLISGTDAYMREEIMAKYGVQDVVGKPLSFPTLKKALGLL